MSVTLCQAAKILIIQAMQLKDFGHEGSDGDFRTNASKTALLENCAEKAARAVLALVTPVDHPEAVGVKIKPLEWNEDGWLDGRAVKWLAVSFGYSWIIRNDDHAFLCCGCRYASLDRAKAAAQSDFETRIRSAIQPSDEAGVAWGDSGPIPGQSFGDEFDAQPQPVAPLRLHFDRETLKRKIEADGEEGEIGAGYEMFPSPALEAGVVEQPGFTYYECPECGFDVIHRADYECRSTACPICAGDSGHDVGMNSRTARVTDKPEGKDARAALSIPATAEALSKDTSRFKALSSADDDTTPTSEDGKP
ncbi:hypothetical protein NKI96_10765 [Mesorhizobium sp. M0292]|uniref:hypothetical protein n=1 Tax=Mesorhizobium sp. M0292 TaxID=2956929 RepID=UPI0033398548